MAFVAGDLCVARRRRCPCITFSLLLDLASQAPSANVMVFLGRDTNLRGDYILQGTNGSSKGMASSKTFLQPLRSLERAPLDTARSKSQDFGR